MGVVSGESPATAQLHQQHRSSSKGSRLARTSAARLKQGSGVASSSVAGSSSSAAAAAEPPLNADAAAAGSSSMKHRFEITKKLGSGTYGKVSLAYDHKHDREVAVKLIKKSAIENKADLARIRREIRIMGALHHPNIIQIYEVFENRDKIILVMEYASGGELYDYVSTYGSLPEAEARRIFRQITSAVLYCHKHQVAHRDLKLENILLDANNNAKIADFGLSNYFSDKALLTTFCGSPLYASPEIINGTPYKGPEVDCWSLGILLYTLVYGSMPFDGRDFNRMVRQIKRGAYYEPDTPSTASMLIRNMLRVNPDRRATIDDVASHWWLNLEENMPVIQELPENQITDSTPLTEREETMVVQKLADETDVFMEFSHLSDETRAKIEEFRRRRHNAEAYNEQSAVKPPKAARRDSQEETLTSADKSLVDDRPKTSPPPNLADPLERLRQLESRLAAQTQQQPLGGDHLPQNAAAGKRVPVPFKAPGIGATSTSNHVPPPQKQPVEAAPPPPAPKSIQLRRPTVNSMSASTWRVETDSLNMLMNEVLEQMETGPVSMRLVARIKAHPLYEQRPMVKELLEGILAAQPPAIQKEASKIIEQHSQDLVRSRNSTQSVRGQQPGGSKVAVEARISKVVENNNGSSGSSSSNTATVNQRHADTLRKQALAAAVAAQNGGSGGGSSSSRQRPWNSVEVGFDPDDEDESPESTDESAAAAAAQQEVTVLTTSFDDPSVKQPLSSGAHTLAAAEKEVTDIEDELEDEKNDDNGAAAEAEEEEEEEYSDSELEDLADEVEAKESPPAPARPTFSTSSNASGALPTPTKTDAAAAAAPSLQQQQQQQPPPPPTPSSTAKPAEASKPDPPDPTSSQPQLLDAFDRGLVKRQSKGKYQGGNVADLYGRGPSVEPPESVVLPRHKIGGAQPAVQQSPALFDRAKRLLLRYPEPPAFVASDDDGGGDEKKKSNKTRPSTTRAKLQQLVEDEAPPAEPTPPRKPVAVSSVPPRTPPLALLTKSDDEEPDGMDDDDDDDDDEEDDESGEEEPEPQPSVRRLIRPTVVVPPTVQQKSIASVAPPPQPAPRTVLQLRQQAPPESSTTSTVVSSSSTTSPRTTTFGAKATPLTPTTTAAKIDRLTSPPVAVDTRTTTSAASRLLDSGSIGSSLRTEPGDYASLTEPRRPPGFLHHNAFVYPPARLCTATAIEDNGEGIQSWESAGAYIRRKARERRLRNRTLAATTELRTPSRDYYDVAPLTSGIYDMANTYGHDSHVSSLHSRIAASPPRTTTTTSVLAFRRLFPFEDVRMQRFDPFHRSTLGDTSTTTTATSSPTNRWQSSTLRPPTESPLARRRYEVYQPRSTTGTSNYTSSRYGGAGSGTTSERPLSTYGGAATTSFLSSMNGGGGGGYNRRSLYDLDSAIDATSSYTTSAAAAAAAADPSATSWRSAASRGAATARRVQSALDESARAAIRARSVDRRILVDDELSSAPRLRNRLHTPDSTAMSNCNSSGGGGATEPSFSYVSYLDTGRSGSTAREPPSPISAAPPQRGILKNKSQLQSWTSTDATSTFDTGPTTGSGSGGGGSSGVRGVIDRLRRHLSLEKSPGRGVAPLSTASYEMRPSLEPYDSEKKKSRYGSSATSSSSASSSAQRRRTTEVRLGADGQLLTNGFDEDERKRDAPPPSFSSTLSRVQSLFRRKLSPASAPDGEGEKAEDQQSPPPPPPPSSPHATRYGASDRIYGVYPSSGLTSSSGYSTGSSSAYQRSKYPGSSIGSSAASSAANRYTSSSSTSDRPLRFWHHDQTHLF